MRTELIAILALCGACKKTEPAKTAEPAKTGPVGGAAPPLVAKEHFRVDAGPRTPCTVGQVCEARVVLSALGAYHVNDKYPFKLEPDPKSGVTVEGTGDWALDDAKTGTLTVKYKAAKPGPAKLAGTFKLSVCTDENCAIESPAIALDVTAN